MAGKHHAEPTSHVENRLRNLRAAKGLSQGELAATAGMTRQAICAIESNHHLPTTAVALRLADALGCRVEDLFRLRATGEVLEGELLETSRPRELRGTSTRVKVSRVGTRIIVRPLMRLGEVLAYTVPADGLLVGATTSSKTSSSSPHRVQVRLLRERRAVEHEIAVAGCEPAIFLAGEHLRRRHEMAGVIGWTMGSAAALEALKREEVHVAGLHIRDSLTGESNLPYLRRHLRNRDYVVVTFATWEEGFILRPGNPKGIREIADVIRPDVRLINRETGSGARLVLDRLVKACGAATSEVTGYETVVRSHFKVARTIAEGRADVGIGTRAAANLFGLGFVVLHVARYDLVTPKAYVTEHPSLANLFDTIISRPFRSEIEALGGYDTSETGKVHGL